MKESSAQLEKEDLLLPRSPWTNAPLDTLQNFYVLGTLSSNTQIRVAPNHMGVCTEKLRLRAVSLCTVLLHDHECRMSVIIKRFAVFYLRTFSPLVAKHFTS